MERLDNHNANYNGNHNAKYKYFGQNFMQFKMRNQPTTIIRTNFQLWKNNHNDGEWIKSNWQEPDTDKSNSFYYRQIYR